MIAAIGAATAAKLPRVDLVPRRNLSEGLVEDFPAGTGRVLMPRAAVARDVAPEGLRAKGWSVDVVETYRTVPASPDVALIVEAKKADAIAFTSASTVTNYLAAAGRDALPPVVVCIGPATADRARHERVTVDRIAEPHTLLGLVSALVDALAPV